MKGEAGVFLETLNKFIVSLLKKIQLLKCQINN